jgi:rare lipoprotein A
MMVTTGIAVAATPEDDATVSGGRADTTVKVDVKHHVRTGNVVRVTGKVHPADSRRVMIKAAGKKVTSVKSKPNGTFSVRWRTPGAGVYKVKAVAQATYSAERAGSAEKQVNVYRSAQASYYGPGLYGNGTACGQTLTPSTLGVANKSLPCGTMVTFRYRGKSVRVPVIDRGPYAGNREWDLTAATKAKLGFGSTGAVLATK